MAIIDVASVFLPAGRWSRLVLHVQADAHVPVFAQVQANARARIPGETPVRFQNAEQLVGVEHLQLLRHNPAVEVHAPAERRTALSSRYRLLQHLADPDIGRQRAALAREYRVSTAYASRITLVDVLDRIAKNLKAADGIPLVPVLSAQVVLDVEVVPRHVAPG